MIIMTMLLLVLLLLLLLPFFIAWEKTMLFILCSVVDCGTPSTISNGDVIFSSTTFGANVTYFCNDSYNMTNPAAGVRVCTEDGYWSGSLPECLCKSEYLDTDV